MSRVSSSFFALGVVAGAAALLASTGSGDAKTLSDTLPDQATSDLADVELDVSFDRSAVLQGSEGLVHAEVVIRSKHAPDLSAEVPTDLVVVLDVSGSMAGEKLENARRATQELVDLLGPQDRFGLVTYDNSANVAVKLASASDRNKGLWASAIRGLRVGGNTNLARGLDVGRQLHDDQRVGRAARTVLLSDGLANEGDTSHEGLMSRARAAGIDEAPLSAVGVGADFDEHLMSRLADAGTGSFYFLETGSSLGEVFATELRGSRETVVSGLSVALDLPEGIELVDAGGYPIEGDGFRVGSLFAGQERRIWLTLKVPTVETGDVDLGEVGIAWTDLGGHPFEQIAAGLGVEVVEDPDRALASVDADAWGRVVVKEQYQALKSEVAKDVKSGNVSAAKQKIALYKSEVERDNVVVGSAAVTANLAEVDELEAEVDDAFEGPDAAEKQVWASKRMMSSSYSQRRGTAEIKDEE